MKIERIFKTRRLFRTSTEERAKALAKISGKPIEECLTKLQNGDYNFEADTLIKSLESAMQNAIALVEKFGFPKKTRSLKWK